MKTIVITKVFPNGTVRISCSQLASGTSLRDLISDLDYMMSVGLLYSYEIEIVN